MPVVNVGIGIDVFRSFRIESRRKDRVEKGKDTSVAAKLALVDSFEPFIAINDPPGALSSQLAK